MLDLGNIKQKFYQIKTVEGEILNIRMPSQTMYNKILQLQNLENAVEGIESLYSVFVDILNLNINGKEYDLDYAQQFDINTIVLVFQDYFKFVGDSMGE